ncbi:MAG: DNA-binding domain-containing protein [Paracoccaceae bacterium]|nr:DNA-binding domain-containing protein [Paracoccaceae bacterium]
MIVDQTTFRAALLSPEAERPIGLSDGEGQPAGRRFDVYRNNVAVSLTEALETAFPVIRKLVGETNFKLLAGAFLRQHPPSSPLMMFYGAEMPRFLAAFEPTKSLGYLPDVARLELAIRESYHAADAAPIEPTALQTTPPDKLMASTLSLAPALRLVRSPWPVFALWQFNMAGGPKPEANAEDVLVVRTEYDPEPVLLPPGGGAFIETLLSGAALSEAISAASRDAQDFDLSHLLTILIGRNAITAIGESP